MTETKWNEVVGRLRKGHAVRLDDGCKIVPLVSESGVAYSLRSDCNCIIYTPDLDRIKSILMWKPRGK